ncbi:hypothetical protein PIB30_025934 [Stylosanthes scabra]|uniref:Uncharacterized protein n=1 Tax=Stylosanthes scabra TaxID=79078 RepID=A0ABU6QB28_9FABA|nr:hypothetical protein [Stylosanthes scabra]
MAKNNKFTSINFNHIYDKTSSNHQTPKTASPSSLSSPSFSASYSSVSAPNKPHGRILVLTRPTPKPVTPPAPSPSKQPPPTPTQPVPDQPRSQPDSDAISLRPQGRTGSGPVLSSPTLKDRPVHVDSPPPLISPKPDKFVPPHLRPGYVPRVEEAPPGPELGRGRDLGYRRGAHAGSAGKFGEDGRPKSGGYERIRRAGGSDVGPMGRPRSSGGSRPSSSG